MCQLLGISSNKPVDLLFSFQEWRHRGEDNWHGYGFAWWENSKLYIKKEASSLYSEQKSAKAVMAKVRSTLFVCHVRLSSGTPQDGKNTHPFEASLGDARLAFAHNGTLDQIIHKRTIKRTPTGQTDSEYAFLWLLDQISKQGRKMFEHELKAAADDLRNLGWFNFLLSDGHTLWAYADNSLYFIERTPPYGGKLVKLVDDGYEIGLADVKAPDERAVIVATKPLTNEAGWKRMNKGELLVVRAGSIVGWS